MTKRETKYHKRKYWYKWLTRMIAMTPEQLADDCRKREERLYYYATKHGIETSATPRDPVTVTITKYNLPNNSSLREGQLN